VLVCQALRFDSHHRKGVLTSVFPHDYSQFQAASRRAAEKSIKRDRRKLFRALADFVNIRSDKSAWLQFRKRWPNFFPSSEYDKVFDGSSPSITTHPEWVLAIWDDSDASEILEILLGIKDPPDMGPDSSQWTHEDAYLQDITSIPAPWTLDWNKGSLVYFGACDFQRALYLLFLESWRARTCSQCQGKFIASRAAQKYCHDDCSKAARGANRRKWWREHGEQWRKDRRSRLGGKLYVTKETR
jgi:hypothetical protein